MTTVLPRWDERSFTHWGRWFNALPPVRTWVDNFGVARDRWDDLFITPAIRQQDSDHIVYMMMLVKPIHVEVYEIVDGCEVNRRPADIRRFDR